MDLFEGKGFKIYHGNMLDMSEIIKPNSIDSVITDPPYELNFMGKGWDNSGIAFQADTWKKCFEVLKSGGYLLAFGGSRTFHRIAVAIEEAGFEIRDVIMWLYGSGFPKSMNIGLAIDKKNGVESEVIGTNDVPDIRSNNYENNDGSRIIVEKKKATNEWEGWGTALKPSYEPIIVARKPCEGSCTDNVIKYGVGGLNIDECRVGSEELHNSYAGNKNGFTSGDRRDEKGKGLFSGTKTGENVVNGRFPANTILTYDDTDFEEVCGGFPNTKSNGGNITHKDFSKHKGSMMHNTTLTEGAGRYGNDYIAPSDSGSAARYFYCAKASKRDRDEGCDALNDGLLRRMRPDKDDSNPTGLNKEGRFAPVIRKNTHPTVKPTSLMQYLVRMVTPRGGTVLDPFNGSGSTGKAVMYENKDRNADYKYIGIELTEEYIPIAIARIQYVCGEEEVEEPAENTDGVQMTIFDFISDQ